MNIIELINAAGGPDVVTVQFIDECAGAIDWKKDHAVIKLHTDAITQEYMHAMAVGKPTKKVGMILWFDRESVQKATADAQKKGEA